MSDDVLQTDLTGRVAFVTGAGSGLGEGFSHILARAGASVVVAGRRAENLNLLVEEIGAKGGKAAACALDVCDAAAIPKAIDFAESQFGTVDILVNNAGIADSNYATKLSLELIDRVIDTNFRGPFLLATEVARRLIAKKQKGNVVNISSSGAYHFTPTTAAALYCATKSGIIRMTETLALEWAAFGINVNAIAPGFFRSEMSGGYIDRVGDQIVAQYPRRRIGEPAYLDSTLLYLVSPHSHFVTGACIIVDDAQLSR